ncbi:MAG: SurA N-terminal domain-containing protein [Pseudomonadota bacterium]
MLGELRRHSKSAIIYFLFAIIIVVFVFTFNTGSQSGGCGSAEVPVYAEVNGHTIDQSHVYMGMRLLPGLVGSQDGMALLMGMGVDIMSLYSMDPENLTPAQGRAVMEALQGIFIISDEAERLGFSVSEKELAKALYPQQFYDEKEAVEGDEKPGKEFNWKDYNAWVSYWLRASQTRYEEYTRRVLLAKKMMMYFSGLVQVTDADAEATGLAKKHQVNLEVVEFAAGSFTDAVEIPGDMSGFIEESQGKIDEYYDAHPAEFHSERQLQIRVALASALPPAPPGLQGPAPEANWDQARTKADELLARLNGDKPLLPEVPPPAPAPEGEEAAPAPAKVEEPTEPEARFRELAKHWSDDGETRDRSGTLIGWQEIDTLGLAPYGAEVLAALTGAKEGDVVGPIKGETGYWLIRVEGDKAARDLSIEDARPEIAETLYRQANAREAAKAKAETLLAAAKAAGDQTLEQVLGGGDLSDTLVAARKTGLFPATTPRSSIPTVGPVEDLFRDAFRLTETAPLAGVVYEETRSERFFVVRLVERQAPPADEALTEDDIEAARETLSVERDVAFFQAWYDSLLQRAREEGDIEYTESYDTYLQFLQANIETREAQAVKQAARDARRGRR